MAEKSVSAKRSSTPRQREQHLGKEQPSPATWKRVFIGSSSVLLLALCIYRILTFVPQPLDSPGTLRPLLYALFTRFVKHYPNPEQAQQAWTSFSLLALFIPTILAVLNYGLRHSVIQAPTWVRKVVGSRLLFFGSVAACLVVCRFFTLLLGQINPDEPLFLAAADKLFRDPVFFRAVDCGTTGPLNIFPLMLPALFGFTPDYASARLIALLIIFLSVYTIYRMFALLADEAVARIALLPAAGAFAVLKHTDLLHYSSEHVSFVLLSLGLYVCVKVFRDPQTHAWKLAGLGLLTAAAFFAKMQAVPIIGCISIVAIVYVYGNGHARRSWRPLVVFAAGLAPLFVLNTLICAAAGVWNDFWTEYIVANYQYTESHGAVAVEISHFADFVLGMADIRALVVTLLAILAAYAYETMHHKPLADQALFLRMGAVSGTVAVGATALLRPDGSGLAVSAGVIGVAMLPGAFVLVWQNGDGSSAPLRWFGFLTAALLAVAAVTVYVPHRAFGHYVLLLVFPLTIAMAWPVVAVSPRPAGLGADSEEFSPDIRQRSPLPFVLLFTTLTLLRQISQAGSPDFMAFAGLPSTVRTPESGLIDSLTQPKDGIAVWGWDSRPYLGAGRLTATKDIAVAELFVPNGEVRAYYRETYLRGLQRHRPRLFVDAIGTSHGGFANRQIYGLEVIPEINSFVRSNYVHVLGAYGQRFYIRRDLARSVAGIGEPRKCDPQAIRCFEAGPASWTPTDLPPIQMPVHALLEVIFTPETKQDLYATVFSNDGGLATRDGFQFQHVSTDHYRLAIGWGPEWVVSKELLLPQRRPVSLGVEFNGDLVTIVCNGVKRDEMRLPKRMLDSPGPITVGSWIGHQRPFLGNIQFFQIRNLGKGR